MGLFSTTQHFHGAPDNSVNIRFPDTIKVEEHRAPTDESIRLAEEYYEKALNSIVAKVEVKDNLITGEVFLVDNLMTSAIDTMRIVCKFKINGHDFKVEKTIDRRDLLDSKTSTFIYNIEEVVRNYGKSIILWYTLKMFAAVAIEQITGSKAPDYLIDQIRS